MFTVIFTQAARAELTEAQNGMKARLPDWDVRRFPYALFFVVEQQTLFVIACFHVSHDPSQWQRHVTRRVTRRVTDDRRPG